MNGVVEDAPDVSKSSVKVTIDAASVDTRVEMRDKDLRSDNFFDVAKYPTITFQSKKVESAGTGKLKVTGDLTMHGVTKEVVLDVDGPTPPFKRPQREVPPRLLSNYHRQPHSLWYDGRRRHDRR